MAKNLKGFLAKTTINSQLEKSINMNSRLLLNELEDNLQFWEDMCSIFSLQKNVLATGNKKLQEIVESMPISFTPGLERYEKLRTCLSSKQAFVGSEFLPAVPDDAKDFLDKINYMRGSSLNLAATLFYPYMMSQWIKTKKVFRVENSGIIPILSPGKKNYLNLLPCDSFIINFLEPVEIGFETSPLIKRYKSCIVSRSGNLVDTFWIPEGLEKKIFKPHVRKLLKSVLQGKNVNEKHLRQFVTSLSAMNLTGNPPFFTTISFRVDKPYIFMTRAKNANGEIADIYYNLYGEKATLAEEVNGVFSENNLGYEDSPRLEDSRNFHKFFFELLNGFCYAVSEIKPKNPLVLPPGKNLNGQKLPQNYVWNEIPITQVDYLEENDIPTDPLRVSYGSGEKSPHVRRGHWRNIIKKDGTSERIWIDQTTVRADKLEKGEELKGNVTVIKQKRLVS